MINQKKISAVLLAGGLGTRMKLPTPKQFLQLKQKPIARYSFDHFMDLPAIDEIIIVCAPPYRHLFQNDGSKRVKFALPGVRRQDSVWNGVQETSSGSDIICIHDSARPFLSEELIMRVLNAADQYGAATVGLPLKFTIKENDERGFVKATLDRSKIWEIQTPQAIEKKLLLQGFEHIHLHNLTVTDDVSIVELLHKPVKLVEGHESNLKITTQADLAIAEKLFSQH